MARKSSSSGSPRPSSSRRKPVTIDLEAKTVSKAETEAAEDKDQTAGGPAGKDAATEVKAAGSSSAKAEPAGKAAETGGRSGDAAAKADADPAQTKAQTKPEAGSPAGPAAGDEEKPKAEPKSAPKPDQAAKRPPQPGGGATARQPRSGLPLIAAALIGGAVTLGGAVALDRLGIIRLGQERPVQAEALKKLESSVADLSGSLAGLRSDIETRISAFSAAVGDSQSLQEQIDGLKVEIAKIPAVEMPDLEPLQIRLAEIESRIESGGAGVDAGLEALQTKLSGALSEIESLGKSLNSLAEGGRARSAAIAAVEERLAGRMDAFDSALSELSARTDLAAAKAGAAATPEQVSEVAETSKTAARKADQAVAIAPVLAAETLQRAVETGRPLEAALNAFASLGVTDPLLDALQPYAKTGLPTLAELKTEFDGLAAGLTATPETPDDGEANALDRLLKGAFSVVKVRPAEPQAGAVDGAGPRRVSGALAAGDLDLAISEWSALPDEQKQASRAWADKAKAVQGALRFCETVRTDALARLNIIQ